VTFVPFLGEIVEWLGLFLALIMATTLSLLTIAVAWIYYRPLLGITILLLALGVLYLLKFVRKQPVSEQKYSPNSVESQLPSMEMQPVLVKPQPVSVQPISSQPRPVSVQPQKPLVKPQPLSFEELPQPSLELPNEPALVPEAVIPNKSA
jgi:hypothetical protein